LRHPYCTGVTSRTPRYSRSQRDPHTSHPTSYGWREGERTAAAFVCVCGMDLCFPLRTARLDSLSASALASDSCVCDEFYLWCEFPKAPAADLRLTIGQQPPTAINSTPLARLQGLSRPETLGAPRATPPRSRPGRWRRTACAAPRRSPARHHQRDDRASQCVHGGNGTVLTQCPPQPGAEGGADLPRQR
jgi:hypothetical protein